MVLTTATKITTGRGILEVIVALVCIEPTEEKRKNKDEEENEELEKGRGI